MAIGKNPEAHLLLKLARYAGSFALNSVLASVGTNMLTVPFEPRWMAQHLQMSHMVPRSELLPPGRSSVLYQQGPIQTIQMAYSLISGADCINNARTCLVWADYPLQCWRTIFYSAGAACTAGYVYVRKQRGA